MVHTDAATDGRVILDTPPGAVLAEKIAGAWYARLKAGDLDVCHFRNAASPALGAALARDFPADQYAQVRLSVSQTFFLDGRPWRWETLKKLLLESLAQAVAEWRTGQWPRIPFDCSKLRDRCSLQSMISGSL